MRSRHQSAITTESIESSTDLPVDTTDSVNPGAGCTTCVTIILVLVQNKGRTRGQHTHRGTHTQADGRWQSLPPVILQRLAHPTPVAWLPLSQADHLLSLR